MTRASLTQENRRPPSVFISYSWDSEEHKKWVLGFAEELREHGIDAVIDQTHLLLGARSPEFMERSVRESGRVLVVCTEMYKQRFDNRKGGADYEGHVITGEIVDEVGKNKFVPILRNGDWKTAVPTALSGVYGVDLRNNSPDEYRKLIENLNNISRIPPVGQRPTWLGGASESGDGRVATMPVDGFDPKRPTTEKMRLIAFTTQIALRRINYWKTQNIVNLAATYQIPSTIDLIPDHASKAALEAGCISQDASAELGDAFESMRFAKQELDMLREARMPSPELYQHRSAKFLQYLDHAMLQINSALAHLREATGGINGVFSAELLPNGTVKMQFLPTGIDGTARPLLVKNIEAAEADLVAVFDFVQEEASIRIAELVKNKRIELTISMDGAKVVHLFQKSEIQRVSYESR